MAGKSKAATAAAMNAAPATSGSKAAAKAAEADVDFTVWASKAPTDLQKRFGPWLMEKVGLEFATKKEEAAFFEGVRLATALRIPFQSSPENQAARAEKAAEPKPEKVEKTAKKAAKTAAPAAEDPAETTPAKPGRKPRKSAPTEAQPF